ncbi:hypothetical protein [Pleurocapsa sp. PCC 7319]|uniref:hypothetical protein n=1 Tax=Pleurocapsa sp. PCC 7319 TaxID=118161 RepID=UPI000347F4EC|nr:hypothetical protein [Pleurocapsa sp. PCC 7319]
MTENSIAIALSVLFWLTPVALTIHLAIQRKKSNNYKKKLGYIYGGLWAIAFLGYCWLFIN